MDAILPILISALAAYVIGATPFGYLAGKWKGIDIREHGSGNIGATNVLRVLGKGIGIPVFVLDLLKGMVPVWLAGKFACCEGASIAAGLGTILGHNFTFWLRFKGGKGVATSAGVMIGLLPLATLVSIAVWILSFFTTRYVAVASIAAAAALPLAALWKPGYGSIFWFSLAVGGLAIWRHRSNIQRLRAGTENKFERRKKAGPSAVSTPPSDQEANP